MILLRYTDTEGGGESTSQNIDIKNTEKPVSFAEEMARQTSLINSANAKRGGIHNTVLNPMAAEQLPEGNLRSFGMGRSGMLLLGGTAPQFPWAAYAIQHAPKQDSPNTKLMSQYLENLQKQTEGKSDPLVERGIDKMVNNDLLPSAFETLGKFPASMQKDIMTGDIKTQAEEKAYLDIHRKASFINNLRNLSVDIKDHYDKLKEEEERTGLIESPQMRDAYSNYVATLHNSAANGKAEEDDIKLAENTLQHINGFQNLDKTITGYVPPNFDVLTKSVIVPASVTKTNPDGSPVIGKDGKPETVPIAGAYDNITSENPQTQELFDKVKGIVDETYQSYKGQGDEATAALANQLGVKNNETDIKQGLAGYVYSRMPQKTTQTLHNERAGRTVVNLGQEKEVGKVYSTTQSISLAGGAIKQDVDSYTLPTPAKIQLGTISNVINSKGESVTSNVEGDVGSVIKAKTVIRNGKPVILNDGEDDPSAFYAPWATIENNVHEVTVKGKDKDGKPLPNIPAHVEEYHVPLGDAANAIKSSDIGEVIVDKAYGETNDQNQHTQYASDAARKKALDDYEKYFGIRKTEIDKNKKTGQKSTKESTVNKAFTY